MANGNNTINYQGGGDTVLTGFYNTIAQGLYAQQERAMQIEEQERKRGEAIANQAQQSLSKIDTKGLRPQDIEDFNKLYSGIKESYYGLISADSNEGRLKAQAQMQERIREANQLISESKETSGTLATLLEDVRKYPDKYDEGTVSYIEELNNRKTRNLNPEDLNPSRIARKIDTSKVPGEINGLIDNLIKTQGSLTGVNESRLTGGNLMEYREGIEKQVFVAEMLTREADPRFRKFIQDQAPGATYEEGVAAIADIYEQRGAFERTEGRQFVRDRAPRASSTTSGSSTGSAAEDATFNTVQSFSNGSSFTSPVALPVKSDNVSITSVDVVDLGTGELQRSATGKIDATGLMKVPVLKNSDRNVPKGSIATTNYANANPDNIEYKDYYIGNLEQETGSLKTVRPVLVPRDRFPTTTKQIKTDLETFDEISRGFQQPQTTQGGLLDNL